MERSLKRLYDIVYITLNILHFEDIQDEIGRVTVSTFHDTTKREWCDEVQWITLENRIFHKPRASESVMAL